MTLDDQQIERFSRQIILSEIGPLGQERLLHSRVLVVGLIPSIATALTYLAAAGIGEFGLADACRLTTLDDLAAPLAFSHADIGRPRAQAAAKTLLDNNPAVRVSLVDDPLVALQSARWHTALSSVHDAQLVARCNRACMAARTPLMVIAEQQGGGWMAGLAGYQPGMPCWECLRQAMNGGGGGNGLEGIIERGGDTLAAGVIGAMAATETIKLVLGLDTAIVGHRVVYEPGGQAVRTVALSRDPRCTACDAAGSEQTTPAA